jgi:glycosyltransferase involved in cell wall biosynthesis
VKVGFVSVHDPADHDSLSGMPFSMKHALKAKGCSVLSFVPSENRRRWHHQARSTVGRILPRPVKDILKRMLARDPAPAPSGNEQAYRRVRDEAGRLSREVREQVRKSRVDVLFGCCISTLLCEMEVEAPIVYFSDTTARLIFESYPRLRSQPEGYRRACDELERLGMKRAAAVVLATERARRSAIEDYGVPPDRAFTVPMGANVDGPPAPDPEAPSKEALRLVITASDPERKRLDLAIDAVEELRRMGWAATLEVVGPPTPRSKNHPHVRCLGALSLRTAAGRRANREALIRSHLMILPSVGEAFGIAPCEAALLGRPSIVSAAGGLPEVVRDGETGLVMGLESGAAEYARALAALAARPERYRAMAAAAMRRARGEFTWERWGVRLVEIMNRVRKKG